MWILGNDHSINFWYESVQGSHLINKIDTNMDKFINKQAKASDFSSLTKRLKLGKA